MDLRYFTDFKPSKQAPVSVKGHIYSYGYSNDYLRLFPKDREDKGKIVPIIIDWKMDTEHIKVIKNFPRELIGS